MHQNERNTRYAYAVCMSQLRGGDAYMRQVGHAGDYGRTLCGRDVKTSKNWRLGDSRDPITCNACRKALGLEPGNFDPKWY